MDTPVTPDGALAGRHLVLGLSGLWVALQAEETHPRLNPADPEARSSLGST